ncbi:EEV host range protein [Moosepox virus GoldyGopher14]|nr:EEV host range protein [Moosepox virus GoldyGopher14]
MKIILYLFIGVCYVHGVKSIYCDKPDDISNGFITELMEKYEVGKLIEYTCNTDYALIGDRFRTCIKDKNNAAWSNKAPFCMLKECNDPPSIINGKIYNKREMYKVGDEIYYVCNEHRGVQYSLVGNEKITCTQDKSWKPDPPICKMINCRFPALQNGYINGIPSNKKFYYKTRVGFSCKSGFDLVGEKYSTCNINATWFPSIPTCVRNKPIDDIIYLKPVDDNFDDLDNEDKINTILHNNDANSTRINQEKENGNIFTVIILLSIISFMFILGVLSLLCSCMLKSSSKTSVYNKL